MSPSEPLPKMSIPLVNAGWTNTDDDAPSVRVTAASAAKKDETIAMQTKSPASELPVVHKYEKHNVSVQPNPQAMRLSAVAGIALVLIAMTMYLGIDTLRGSLTQSGSTVTTVTITAGNTFSPPTIAVAAGTTITLENKNPNPEVIKSRDGRELFPTQLIFDKPYTFTIPADVSGTFTYISETMPEDQTLTIVVTPTIEAGALSSSIPSSTSTSPADSVLNADDFPLPFGGPVEPVSNPSAASPSDLSVTAPVLEAPTPQASTNVSILDGSNTTEVISVGGSSPAEQKNDVSFGGNAIPTNPYTVGSKNAYRNAGSDIAASSKNLHGGAPLLEMQQYRPRVNTSTGPAAWGVFVSAVLLMCVAYKKKILQ